VLNPGGPSLDPVLHQPVRTRLVAFLAGRGEATFNEIKQAIAVTDGNLDSHIKKLVAARYLTSRKDSGTDSRTQTFYALTRLGAVQFKKYVAALQEVLDLA
jgi:DNA-binding MarR family transcriptional regulator